MIYLAVTLGLSNIGLVWLVYSLNTNARLERKAMQDRLIALSRPEAVAVVKAAEDEEGARVFYVDEAAEAEREKVNGHHDLLGDD